MLKLSSYYFWILLFIISCSTAHAIPISDREYKIKTAFMLNFFKLTQWQKTPPDQDFLFCTTNEKFSDIAKPLLQSKKVRGHSIQIIYTHIGKEASCDALFITKFETSEWKNHLIKHPHKGILIIGEPAGFAKNLGHIRLFRINNKLRFQVNINALKKSHLKMSPKLLRLAIIVNNSSGKGNNQ